LTAAGRNARSAKVTGAPRTRKIGLSIDSVMCCAMCTLNSTGAYRPTPLSVTTTIVARPQNHATVRPTGQLSPRRRSRSSAPA
jgi:hypothetical protein